MGAGKEGALRDGVARASENLRALSMPISLRALKKNFFLV